MCVCVMQALLFGSLWFEWLVIIGCFFVVIFHLWCLNLAVKISVQHTKVCFYVRRFVLYKYFIITISMGH